MLQFFLTARAGKLAKIVSRSWGIANEKNPHSKRLGRRRPLKDKLAKVETFDWPGFHSRCRKKWRVDCNLSVAVEFSFARRLGTR